MLPHDSGRQSVLGAAIKQLRLRYSRRFLRLFRKRRRRHALLLLLLIALVACVLLWRKHTHAIINPLHTTQAWHTSTTAASDAAATTPPAGVVGNAASVEAAPPPVRVAGEKVQQET
eukprot:jgi/Chlat1/980/Chrsp108S01437